MFLAQRLTPLEPRLRDNSACVERAMNLDPAPSPSEPPSPCIGVCVVSPATATCEGCARTLAEIAAWPALGEQEKRAVLERIEERR
ncbi:MAG: DUF1289 domain-containing protein [Planctomycetota bacterium]